MAGPTGLEPATSGLTGRRSNQLNYDPGCDDGLRTFDIVSSTVRKLQPRRYHIP